MRLFLLIPFLLALAWPPAPARAQGETLTILGPAEGQVVAGVVTITGVAASPAFQRYEIEFGYEPNPTDTWFPIQDPALTPQPGGTLAVWDTAAQGVADGVYVLRLRLYRVDGSFIEAFAHNIILRNGNAAGPEAAQPGGTGEPPALPDTPTATGVFVDLPPTSTPRPTVTPQPTDAPRPGPPGDNAGPSLSLQLFERAFVRGIGWTVAAFIVLGIYLLLRPRVRPAVWRLMRRLVRQR